MPVYQYVAKNINGEIIKGKMEALDEGSVITGLIQKNYYPMTIKIHNEAMNIDLSKYAKIPLKDIAIFCRQFAFILTSGIPILKALQILREQMENSKLKRIISAANEDVQRGKSLSEAMRLHKDIPEMLINMIAMGETSGTLDNVMMRMADYYDKSYKQQQKIKGSLTYPTILSVFALLVVAGLVTFILPIFVNMIVSNGGVLPTPTRIVLAISNFLKTRGLFLILVIILAIIFINIYIKSNEIVAIKLSKLKLKIPIIGKVTTKILTARFARTFGIMMASGVPVITSIEICSTIVGNKYIANSLKNVQENIRKGVSIGESLDDKRIFPVMLTQMIKIGEESGTLDSILDRTAEYYDGEVEAATAKLTTLVEPIIIIFLAVVVGFIVLAMILPVFEMMNTVGNA
jgi:type IV pilus assembly protein PilC